MENKPIILNAQAHKLSDLEDLRRTQKIWQESDFFDEQLEELFFILHPPSKLQDHKKSLEAFKKERSTSVLGGFVGCWVYYPWNGYLVHILAAHDFFLVRTNRNKNIITAEEQTKLYNFPVAVLGLSIGNGMALNLAYSGFARRMKLADFDTLELSNLNRIRAGITDLGLSKVGVTSRQIYEINPYADLQLFSQAIKSNNLAEFISDGYQPGLIFEAIDDFEIKIRIRLEAKKLGIPVIMLTNLADRLLIDVERYDLDSELVIFNGLIGDVIEEILNQPISEADKQRFALAIVGKENVTKRVYDSVMEVNKTLVGRPQIMSTVTIGGGVAAYLMRRLVFGPDLPSGRFLVDFESLIK